MFEETIYFRINYSIEAIYNNHIEAQSNLTLMIYHKCYNSTIKAI